MIKSKSVGIKLKELRIKKKLSRFELAKKLGISPSAISMYENGERVPRDENKVKISKFFDVSIESLFFTK
jgi:transcriptional regulator with XRE-family HTH domain